MRIRSAVGGALLLMILLGWTLLLPAKAQEAQPTRIVTADEVNAVARELWCPLCSGVRLDSCELKACEQMRQEIALKLADGADEAAIKQYFLAQYGPQILGEPPREGFNWLAWILPVVALGAGAAFLITRSRHLFARATPGAAPGGASATAQTTDPYQHKLEEELKRYG